ncbi:MAG TPA: RNA ligase family protein [Aquella sp.]|nr:RNA ligase family protein [Aquella sp.]
MSTLKVPITTITEMKLHPGADRLSIAKVFDYEVIVPRDLFKVGMPVIYVPVGAILSDWLETLIFGEDSKIHRSDNRIKAIKIRGIVSQGMLLDPMQWEICYKLKDNNIYAGNPNRLYDDVSGPLGITKWNPPEKSLPGIMKVPANLNPYKVREFREYTDVEHGKYYDRVLQDGEPVVITQKLHGTSARYGWFKRDPISWLDKALNFLGLLPGWQFCWGSRRCQIQSKPGKTHGGFKDEKQGVDFGDVYTKIAKQEGIREKIPKGYAVYGEIIGWGIQKGYLYNCGLNQHKFYVYDVMHNGKWLNHAEMMAFCEMTGLETVPVLYQGPYHKDRIDEFITVNKISKEPNEGIVIGPAIDRTSPTCGRIKLKYINPEYLMLKDMSEFQ